MHSLLDYRVLIAQYEPKYPGASTYRLHVVGETLPAVNSIWPERWLMSSRLTLLLVCNRRKDYSALITSLGSANFRLTLAETAHEVTELLSSHTVSAILVDQRNARLARSTYRALQQLDTRPPVLMLADGNDAMPRASRGERQLVLHSDPADEVLTEAVAAFLRHTLSGVGDIMRFKNVVGKRKGTASAMRAAV